MCRDRQEVGCILIIGHYQSLYCICNRATQSNSTRTDPRDRGKHPLHQLRSVKSIGCADRFGTTDDEAKRPGQYTLLVIRFTSLSHFIFLFRLVKVKSLPTYSLLLSHVYQFLIFISEEEQSKRWKQLCHRGTSNWIPLL